MTFEPFEIDDAHSGTDGAEHAGGDELFSYEIRNNGHLLVSLRGRQAEGDEVTVEANVFPSGPDSPSGLRRPFTFPTRERALAFVDEALRAFDYLACSVS